MTINPRAHELIQRIKDPRCISVFTKTCEGIRVELDKDVFIRRCESPHGPMIGLRHRTVLYNADKKDGDYYVWIY